MPLYWELMWSGAHVCSVCLWGWKRVPGPDGPCHGRPGSRVSDDVFRMECCGSLPVGEILMGGHCGRPC
jgi:hypothetical protein